MFFMNYVTVSVTVMSRHLEVELMNRPSPNPGGDREQKDASRFSNVPKPSEVNEDPMANLSMGEKQGKLRVLECMFMCCF